MYSPSAKHAPHSELPFAFTLTPNPPPASKLVGSADGKSKPMPQKGSLYACSVVLDMSVMYQAVIR